MRVFLAGEGKAELGDWAKHPSYHSSPPESGLIEALLHRVQKDGWEVGGAVCWKNIPKYRAAHSRHPAEVANVLGLVMKARAACCNVVAFSRDRDRDQQRAQDVQAGIARAREIPDCPAIIGGMAVEALESWVASLQGQRKAEASADPAQLLDHTDVAHMCAVAENAALSELPTDAESLRAWLCQAACVFGVSSETLLGPG